ncbi:MAG: hypothetical protein CL678_15500 [Bdellovibrionaceae bacterium]|nr:hypothetical protein [Pseudobdellovibrionaceae bacterium]
MTPFFEEIDLDVSTVLNSIKTHEKAADISAALVNAIRDLGYRMVRDSGYRQAVEMLTGGVAEETTLVIGTDQVLERFLMVSGDTRTTGIGLVPKVVSSPDTRMVNKIVLSLSRPGESEIDGLSPGVFAWVPELASTTQVTRNGATAKEPTVQPRSRHINTLPVMAVINVIGLTEALTTQTPTP